MSVLTILLYAAGAFAIVLGLLHFTFPKRFGLLLALTTDSAPVPPFRLMFYRYDTKRSDLRVTHFFLIVPFPILASQGFWPGGRTGVVFCSRITALGSYAYDGAGQAKLRSQFWPDWGRILSALAS
jgi:hypothetical protein